MINLFPDGRWDATEFFEHLTATNRLAKSEHFTFCRVSGLDGFEEALDNMQQSLAFVCVSDIANGFTELNNTPRTRRVKTVFMAMRHKIDDMKARNTCMDTMRELFRQFMSLLILEKPNWSSSASTSTREYRSTKLTDISSRAAPALSFRSPSMSIPI